MASLPWHMDEDGNCDILVLYNMNKVETTVIAHNSTGGMMTQGTEVAMITRLGIDVYIAQAATSYSSRALNGKLEATCFAKFILGGQPTKP